MDRIKINQITMKSFKILLSLIAAFAITLAVADQAKAQDDPRAQAVQLYNDAQDLAGSGNFTEAIELFREALELAEENDIDDIAQRIEENLPKIAFSRASNSYRAFQEDRTKEGATKAIEDFQSAKDIADEFGNTQISQQTTSAIPQLYYVRGVTEYREDNFEAAITDLETAIELNANYAAPYYQMAVVLKKQNPEDLDTAIEWYDRAIEVAENANDTRTLNNARDGAKDELIFRAVNLSEDREFSRAIELLNRVEQYDSQSASAHYRLAEIYNKRGSWDEALEHANIALEYEAGGVTDKAKIYFELGTAYKGLGDVPDACSAFENARYGDFSDPANHELQFELKCEGHTPTGR